MSIDYGNLAATAAALVGEFGRTQNVKLHSSAVITYNPTAGAPSGNAAVTSEVAVVSMVGGQLMGDSRIIGQTSIMMFDAKCLFKPTVTIRDDDKIEIDGYVWSILKLREIKPGDTRLLWIVYLKR